MGRSSTPVVVHSLSAAEQRVLSSFIAGRLPAGQVHAGLERARVAQSATPVPAPAPPAVKPVPAVAA